MDGMVARNGGQPDPARECIEILGADPLRPLSFSRRPVAHFDGTDDDDLAGFIGVEVGLGVAEWDLRLVDLDDPLERLALWVDHGAPQLLRQQPSGPVGEAELTLELEGGHAIGMRRHEVGGPEPGGERELRAVHHRAGRHRGLPAAVQALVSPRPGSLAGRRDPGRTSGRPTRQASASRRESERSSPRRGTLSGIRAGRVASSRPSTVTLTPRLCASPGRKSTATWDNSPSPSATDEAICNYILETYGRFPGTVDAMHLMWFMQAHHLDTDYYDRFFRPGACGPTHA